MRSKLKLPHLALAAVALAIMAFTTACDSGVRYSSSNPLVYDHWNTPNPAWRFSPATPHQSCGKAGQGRKVFVSNGNYETYREISVNPADFKLTQVRVTSQPGPASTTLFHAYENGYNRQAVVHGCDNTGLIGDGRIYLAKAKVSRSVTWQCQGALCGPRQHGGWVTGWK